MEGRLDVRVTVSFKRAIALHFVHSRRQVNDNVDAFERILKIWIQTQVGGDEVFEVAGDVGCRESAPQADQTPALHLVQVSAKRAPDKSCCTCDKSCHRLRFPVRIKPVFIFCASKPGKPF